MGLDWYVDSNVLIPRPETEILCKIIVESQKNTSIKRILEVGTGSGCIAIWLKKMYPDADTTAVDISKKALQVAERNAMKHDAQVQFIHSDLLEKIPENTHFDLIVANLPYVPHDIQVTPEVQREPVSAIFADDDGFDIIRRMVKQLQQKQITTKQLWLEHNPGQEIYLRELLQKNQELLTHRDIAGDNRFSCVKTI